MWFQCIDSFLFNIPRIKIFSCIIANILTHKKPPRLCLGGFREEYYNTLFVPSEAADTYSILIMLGFVNPT